MKTNRKFNSQQLCILTLFYDIFRIWKAQTKTSFVKRFKLFDHNFAMGFIPIKWKIGCKWKMYVSLYDSPNEFLSDLWIVNPFIKTQIYCSWKIFDDYHQLHFVWHQVECQSSTFFLQACLICSETLFIPFKHVTCWWEWEI